MKSCLLYFYIFISFLVGMRLSAKEIEPVLVVTGHFPPFVYREGDKKGVISDIVLAVFKHMDVPVKVEYYPWVRCEKMVESGNAFAAFPYFYTEARNKQYYYSEPIMAAFSRVFYLKEQFPNGIEWVDFTDLKPYLIGGVLGYWYIEHYKKHDLRFSLGPVDLCCSFYAEVFRFSGKAEPMSCSYST